MGYRVNGACLEKSAKNPQKPDPQVFGDDGLRKLKGLLGGSLLLVYGLDLILHQLNVVLELLHLAVHLVNE